MLYILNSPILTNYGKYKFERITIEEAKKLLSIQKWISAVGHEATAQFLTLLLGINIPFNRVSISMTKGDQALVFRLKTRLPEGRVLTIEEMKNIDYEIGLLQKIGGE